MAQVSKRKENYILNKKIPIGSSCCCPICKNTFIKHHYAQVFCSNECKNKFHNDKQRGKRNSYYRQYNMKHPERYERVCIDIEFEKWKAKYYNDSALHQEDGENNIMIDDEYLYNLYLNGGYDAD